MDFNHQTSIIDHRRRSEAVDQHDLFQGLELRSSGKFLSGCLISICCLYYTVALKYKYKCKTNIKNQIPTLHIYNKMVDFRTQLFNILTKQKTGSSNSIIVIVKMHTCLNGQKKK